jgi:hypothetical protein
MLSSAMIGLLVVSTLITLVLALNAWFAGPREIRAPRPDPVPDDVAERWGAGTARWLATTRRLRATLLELEEHAQNLLEAERALAAEPRGREREIDDANFYGRIRTTRAAGLAWIDEAKALPPTERRMFVKLAIDPEALRGLFELPWGLTDEHNRKQDRSDEIERVLADCSEANDALVLIDHRLRAPEPAPYR